jgi:hypothetical protein
MNNSRRRTLDRVEGVFVIGNTALPFVLAVLVIWGTASVWAALKEDLARYQRSLTRVIEGAQQAKTELEQVAKEVLQSTRGIRAEGEKAAASVNRVVSAFRSSLDGFSAAFVVPFDSPVVPGPIKSGMRALGKSVTAPFQPLAGELNQVGESIGTIKGEVAGVVERLAQLQKLEVYFDAVIAEYDEIRRTVDAVVATVGRALRILAYVALALASWAAMGYLLWVRGRFRRGLALIRGHPTSP